MVDSKDSLVCCGASTAISVDTSNTPELCSGTDCVDGTTSSNLATFTFDYIYIDSTTTVALDGSRPLVLQARYGMTINGGTWNGTAEAQNLKVTADGGGNSNDEPELCHEKWYDMIHEAKLGGYNGGRATFYSSYTRANEMSKYSSSRSNYEGGAPSGLDGA